MATATQVQEWLCTNDEYHADSSKVSHSMLEAFRRNRRRYHATFIEKTLPKPEPTDSMILGSLFHLRVLEPERFLQSVASAPDAAPDGNRWDRRKTDHKKWWADFEQASAGKQIVAIDLENKVHAMAGAVLRNDAARQLLHRPGPVEHSIVWRCEATGLLLKSRRDKVSPGLLVDLKSCRDASPEGFARAAATLGYARQAAHYIDGELQRTGQDCAFVFIAVETEPPYCVACYELDEAALDLGRQQNVAALRLMADCLASGDWAPPHEKRITTLPIPKWAYYQDEWSY